MSSRGASAAGLPFMLVGGKTYTKACTAASAFKNGIKFQIKTMSFLSKRGTI